MIDHLLRRAGFGASADELAAYDRLSYAEAVDRLVNYDAMPDTVDSNIGKPGYVGTTSNGPFSPDTVIGDARQRWLFRMVHSDRPLQEKMTLFWHNYFATAYSKVQATAKDTNGTKLMNGQMEFLRANALGSLRDLLLGIAKDPAMLIWLDGDTNTKAKPQENFGRELMELFSRGYGYYTEDDVYAAARVFTGWNLDRTALTFAYNATQHETSAKTFSFPIYSDGGHTIPSRAASAGMQDGVDLINALAMHQETATRVVTKLFGFLVSETVAPDPNFINDLATTYLRNGSAIKPVVQKILESPQFQDPNVAFTRYSWPVEFVVRAIKETGWTGFSVGSTLTPLLNMGQELFEPPNVAGWVLGQSWFSTGAMLARMNFASTLALNQKFRIATAAASSRSTSRALVDFLTSRLTADFDSTTYNDLVTYAASGGTWTGSDTQLQTKGSGLVHLILGSAEYQFV
ncbi:MAG TPA: DUF1800 domain-containing protein [Vicinamibacterales bacterium]|nr:DUF1800 domain-containing protein [Vicinamibacterales bacterium]